MPIADAAGSPTDDRAGKRSRATRARLNTAAIARGINAAHICGEKGGQMIPKRGFLTLAEWCRFEGLDPAGSEDLSRRRERLLRDHLASATSLLSPAPRQPSGLAINVSDRSVVELRKIPRWIGMQPGDVEHEFADNEVSRHRDCLGRNYRAIEFSESVMWFVRHYSPPLLAIPCGIMGRGNPAREAGFRRPT
jgi:hypothetical protein